MRSIATIQRILHVLSPIALIVALGSAACKMPPAASSGRGDPARAQASKQPSPPAPPAKTPSTVPIRADKTVFGASELMGTRVSINVYVGEAPSGDPAGAAITAAFEEIARVEAIASEWIPQSELSKLSSAAGQGWRSVSPDLWFLLSRSAAISEATRGRFDISFHSVGQLWNFGPKSTPPRDAKIQAALAKVNYRLIELDPTQSRVRITQPGVALGMGAIAKGYGVDKAAQVLRERGFDNFIVEAGGDTFVSGRKGKAQWRVGIQNPSGPGAIGALEVQNQAVVTSGNYERFFVHDGVHYTHILDPSTGYPIRREHSPRSVSIVASNATDADAYCTAVTVMGRKAGMAFVASRPELEAIIVDADGSLHLSAGLRSLYQPLNHP